VPDTTAAAVFHASLQAGPTGSDAAALRALCHSCLLKRMGTRSAMLNQGLAPALLGPCAPPAVLSMLLQYC
jgi:hypothetical protein